MGLFDLGELNVTVLKLRKDVDGLVKALGSDKDHDVREAAAEALGKIGDPRAVDPLIAALNDPDHDVRKEAEKALSRLR